MKMPKKIAITAELNKDSEQPIKKLEVYMEKNGFKNIKIRTSKKMWGTFKDLGESLKFG